nr:T9SS type A sorting domain-containing protein [uncultured Flavobacterium sp.]
MKRKLLCLCVLSTFNLFAQTNLIQNGGFETWLNSNTLSGWTSENNVTQNTSYYSEGSKSVQLSITDKTVIPKILFQVPMEAGKTYTVRFKYKYQNSNYSGLHPINLKIEKEGSAMYISSNAFASNNNWTQRETTFTSDQNTSYDLSFSIFSIDNESFNVLIDDVEVYIEGSLGIEDSVFDKVALYPNPTKDEVTITNIALEKATVYNTLGQLVKSFSLNSSNTNNTISLGGLPKGVYYVYLINQETASVKKVIVE